MKCWCPTDNGDLSICGAGSQPCGTKEPGFHNSTSGVQLCCVAGDACGANSVCKFYHSEAFRSGDGSGFYLGGCTDHTFKDPLCRNDCQNRGSRLPTEGIVYQPEYGVWSCCGRNASGAINCSVPLDQYSMDILWTPDQFPGPVNESLTPAATTTPTPSSTSLMTSSTPLDGSMSSPAATSSRSSPTVGTSNTKAPTPLSTGAKAGIGVGAAIGGLILIGLVVAVVLLRKRLLRSKRSDGTNKAEESPNEKKANDTTAEHIQPVAYEIDGEHSKCEADGSRWQLGTHGRRAELEQPFARHELGVVG